MKAKRQPFSLERLLMQAWTSRGFVACLLWPVSQLYAALDSFRRALYRAGILKVERVPVTVVVVGNVMAGGVGKTPVVIALVKHLQTRGFNVGVISRGYGRTSTACLEVHSGNPVNEVGDEPALIHASTSAPVFVAARRIEAARQLLLKRPTTQIIICDDGLQHLRLHRDLDICVFDDRDVGNGWLLPAGPLREPWPRAVDFVLHTGSNPSFEGFRGQRKLAPYAIRSDGTQIDLALLVARPHPPWLALAGIARPEQFFDMLREKGFELAQTLALPDHYDFNSWSSNADNAYTVICTEKDALKLWRHCPGALAVPLSFTPEPLFLAELDDRLDRLEKMSAHPRLSSSHGHTTT